MTIVGYLFLSNFHQNLFPSHPFTQGGYLSTSFEWPEILPRRLNPSSPVSVFNCSDDHCASIEQPSHTCLYTLAATAIVQCTLLVSRRKQKAKGRHKGVQRRYDGGKKGGIREVQMRYTWREVRGRYTGGTREGHMRHKGGTQEAQGKYKEGTRKVQRRHKGGTRVVQRRHKQWPDWGLQQNACIMWPPLVHHCVSILQPRRCMCLPFASDGHSWSNRRPWRHLGD